MRKYMFFNPLSGPPWEYPAINKTQLLVPFDKIVYATSKYSLLKSNTLYRTSNYISQLTIIESPFTANIYLVYVNRALEGIPNKLIKMKIIRQSKDKVELIGMELKPDMSYSDYGITIKFSGKNINQIVFHNLEKEFDYEFVGIISNKSKYDKSELKKDIPEYLEKAISNIQKDSYRPMLELLLAKYPNHYKIYYLMGVFFRRINFIDEAIKLNKKYADAYDFKLALLKGDGLEKERYDTLKLLIKYKRHLSQIKQFLLPINYLFLAELEKEFGNSKNAWKYLSKYLSFKSAISDAFYLRAELWLEKKKYKKALSDINKCLEAEKNKKYYFMRAKIKEELGDVDGSNDDKKKAVEIDDTLYEGKIWI